MNRKYRQQGYQDSDREDRDKPRQPPRQNLTKEERIQKRSLRHAIDREANEVMRCFDCGRNASNFGGVPTPTAVCPHCSAPLHCCRTCTHFDTAARWQCRATITEAVSSKTKGNECKLFQPRLVLDVTGRRSNNVSSSNDPKSQFENLFKR
ncbi:MAG: hypothetical protein GY716_03700 [bacterium]|nr:hypothetical protein [bacterium]